VSDPLTERPSAPTSTSASKGLEAAPTSAKDVEAAPTSAKDVEAAPTSLRPSSVLMVDGDVRHPRGRIKPRLPASAPRSRRFVRALVRLGQGLHYHDVFRAAPAMAFHFFLSLLPLLVFLGYVVGLVARRRGVSAVLGLLLDNLPATSEAIVKNEVSHLATADRLGPLAAIGFLWVASGGTQGLMVAVESVVGAPRRAWWKQRLFAVGWVIATLFAFGIASFGIIEWDDVVHAQPATTAPSASLVPSSRAVDEPPARPAASDSHAAPRTSRPAAAVPKRARKILRSGGERVLTIAFSLAAAVGGLCAFYQFAVSHTRRVRRRLLPGAALAVALWIVISWGFSLYLRTLASYTVYYGGLAAVAVLLVWLWLMSLAILVGAELNSQLEGLRDELEP
jgi:membrane protein